MTVLPENYSEIFNRRGELYHKAMLLYPNVRKEEFLCSLDNVIFKDGDTVCDIPSGGGYIAQYINNNCNLISVEFSRNFSQRCKNVILSSQNTIPLKDNSINTAISIAGVHHHNDQKLFYNAIYDSLKENGVFILADVQINSKVAYFLDNIVGKYNSTGHQGIYLSSETNTQLINSGFSSVQSKVNKFSWIFKTMHEITDFMKMFFDLKNISHIKLIELINETLGINEKNGMYHVGWELLIYNCKK